MINRTQESSPEADEKSEKAPRTNIYRLALNWIVASTSTGIMLIALTVAISGFGLSAVSISGDKLFDFISDKNAWQAIAAGATAIVTLFAVVLTYLNGSKERSRLSFDGQYDYFLLRKEAQANLRRRLSQGFNQESVNAARLNASKIVAELTESEVLSAIEKRIKEDKREERYMALASKSMSRVDLEIKELQSRGNLNLAIGIVSTIIGITILSVFLFTLNVEGGRETTFLYQFFPRLSLVVFVQVFAFFFLRLYKESLAEIKYYHNELTAIESRVTAIGISLGEKDTDSLRDIVKSLSQVDRNKQDISSGSADVEKAIDSISKILAAVSPIIKRD